MTTIDFDDWELSYIATSIEQEINDANLNKFENVKDYKEWIEFLDYLDEEGWDYNE